MTLPDDLRHLMYPDECVPMDGRCVRHGRDLEDCIPLPRTSQGGLDVVRAVFTRWLGPRFDVQYLDVNLAVVADGMHGTGDPAWLMNLGGPGVGKTETISSFGAAGCHIVSTISGEAALLSGTAAKERHKDATGGLLKVLGGRGVLVIKDFTTILSMRREDRAKVLAALREVYDGRWVRTLGVDGGKTLDWSGRAAVIAGVTGAYDDHHGVIAAMGDRFLLLRLDSEDPAVRHHAIDMSIDNSGGEDEMRHELGAAVAGFLFGVTAWTEPLEPDFRLELRELADLVSVSRSQVGRDFKGDPQYAHAPEVGTRLAKQLVRLYRGGRTIGLTDSDARGIVRRVAHDTMPPARRICLLDVHGHPGSTTTEVAQRTGMAWSTVDRTLQELTLHRMLRRETTSGIERGWRWHPGTEVNLAVLRTGYGQP